MTTNKPSAGAMRASTMLHKEYYLMRNIGLPTPKDLMDCATRIDEETGMPGLLESAEAVMDWQQMLYNESTSSANISFRDWLGNGSVGKLYDALAKTKGEQS